MIAFPYAVGVAEHPPFASAAFAFDSDVVVDEQASALHETESRSLVVRRVEPDKILVATAAVFEILPYSSLLILGDAYLEEDMVRSFVVAVDEMEEEQQEMEPIDVPKGVATALKIRAGGSNCRL